MSIQDREDIKQNYRLLLLRKPSLLEKGKPAHIRAVQNCGLELLRSPKTQHAFRDVHFVDFLHSKINSDSTSWADDILYKIDNNRFRDYCYALSPYAGQCFDIVRHDYYETDKKGATETPAYMTYKNKIRKYASIKKSLRLAEN